MSARNPTFERIGALSENELRTEVLIPILSHTPGISQISDVHGTNEKGLDVIFCTSDAVREKIWYGLQLKRGDISGGGRGSRTVKELIDQLELAAEFEHPVAVSPAGKYRMDYFVVAASGRISQTARDEIVNRMSPTPVDFWDLAEIVRRAKKNFPEVLQVADVELVNYLKSLRERCEVLDALDQVPGVAERRLSEVFIEPSLRRRIDPNLGEGDSRGKLSRTIPALSLPGETGSAVIIGEQNEGKTAILRMIAITQSDKLLDGQDHEDESGRIPVLIRAAQVVQGEGLHVAASQGLRRSRALKRAALLDDDPSQLADYLVLLDGFSEIPEEERKIRCAELVAEGVKAGAQVVVAGRPDDFLRPQYFTTVRHYTIPPFSSKDVQKLVRVWTKDGAAARDVPEKLVERVRDALQLPGSPIPAIIGVMLFEKEQRFITNTADAVDRYMVIRLGRYAREMGIPMEVDWARKQDLLGEIAFTMVDQGQESVPRSAALEKMSAIYQRLGEVDKSSVALEELIAAGVLYETDDQIRFFRTAFRDFFAAHHLVGAPTKFDAFFLKHLFDRRWGQVLVFAAGLRRHNSELLSQLNDRVERERGQTSMAGSEDYLYGAYLLGRILSNSDYSDRNPRLDVLRTAVAAARESADLLAAEATDQFGPIGNVVALLGVEHTLFVAVGVPWLQQQIRELVDDRELPEEERYLLGSLYTNLAGDGWIEVFDEILTEANSPRVIAALLIGAHVLDVTRSLSGEDAERWSAVKNRLARKRKRFGDAIDRAFEVKDRLLQIERDRVRRLANTKD